ncbi:DUF1439 domain-containing protein [Rheinheimera baltica]|uniref:DUF1439 domain-containing protein n=1 Tax=Rheinheimera baltica TaxID=67576 RepID=A0ABT9I2R9_9GAMM|nr:DUF1439 domain-containing protein [Rheinheimera baltica]MDP5137674.1 DUF1439 domain-containing protein [Rheinheimera baltica]MDP5143728.1 DUF1439 domain-containing protein [Rheinheimera baltica]MDP5150905.1 DUF1439 domain-containing protein [Rheinheimera baltica]
MRFILYIFVLLLAGCSQLQQMSTYSVSEADLEQLLRQQIPSLTRQANVAGIPLNMKVDTMQVDIGPDNSDRVRVNTGATATLSLFGLSYPATMQLNVEGVPYYDGAEKAVYLRSVKLLGSTIEAAGYRGNLAPVSNELLALVNGFLANNPVYRLDTSNPTVKLLTAVPINMAVQSGRISFAPGNN